MPVGDAAVEVHGLRQLQILFASAQKEARLGLRRELREVAEPIRADAEQLAASGIRRIGPRWSRMRVGVTRNLVYVAPRQRGVRKGNDRSRKRPKFADLMEQRAMTPALERNKHLIEGRVEDLFGRIASDWNRKG